MKKLLITLGLSVTLATGFAVPASAKHCVTQHGDSMWKIAERYNVFFKEILDLNRHYQDQDLIHPNDKIILPDQNTGTSTVQDGKGNPDAQHTFNEPDSAEVQAVLKLVNQERSKAGLNPLKLSDKLTSIATIKAKDMADKKYFSHDSPTYGSPFQMLQQFGVSYSSAGENIASGQTSAEQVMKDWMNSSGHRANILNKNYTELGVGYYKGDQTEWVQLFIRP